MAEDKNQSVPNQDDIAESVKRDAKGLLESISTFLKELLDIRSETDKDRTIEDVKNDIPFKGHNAWILIFSVFVASIFTNSSFIFTPPRSKISSTISSSLWMLKSISIVSC